MEPASVAEVDRRPTYVLVHGTFAKGAAWTKEGSALRLCLANDGVPADFETPQWSGENLYTARQTAVDYIKSLLDNVPAERPIFLIGHSHGGSSIAYLMKQWPELRERVCGVAYLSTPFIALRPLENIEALWSNLLVTRAILLSWCIGLVVSFAGAYFDFPQFTDLAVPLGLFAPALIASIIMFTTLRRLRHAGYVSRNIAVRTKAFAEKHDTAALKVDEKTIFFRATGDEAASFLSFFQFLGWLMSRFGGSADKILTLAYNQLIRPLTDQNPFAHSLRPMDMMRQGWLSSFRQASQQ